MDETAARHRVRRYIDEVGTGMMITAAKGVAHVQPLQKIVVAEAWFFAGHDVSMVANRDAIERRSRGLLGGAIQQEMMMATNYETTTNHPVPQSAPAKPATEARQGVISGRVLLVLVASTTLAIIALVVAYAFI